jgi:hypothetical protein
LSEDKRKQDVNMKRWVRRASKAEEMVLKLEKQMNHFRNSVKIKI